MRTCLVCLKHGGTPAAFRWPAVSTSQCDGVVECVLRLGFVGGGQCTEPRGWQHSSLWAGRDRWGVWWCSMLELHTPLSLYLRQWFSVGVVTYLLTTHHSFLLCCTVIQSVFVIPLIDWLSGCWDRACTFAGCLAQGSMAQF